MSASIHWIDWRSASGRPNVDALLGVDGAELETAFGDAESAGAVRIRPTPSHCWASLKPSPSSPTRCATGTRTLSSTISQGRSPIMVLYWRGQLHAGRVHVDDEAGNAAVRALGAVGRRHQLHEIGVAGAGDEALDAVDDVMVAVTDRDGAHAARDRSRHRARSGRSSAFLAAQRPATDSAPSSRRSAIENCAHGRPDDPAAARRQRDGARQLGPNDDARQHRIPAPPYSSGTSIIQSPGPWRAAEALVIPA